MQHMKPVRIKYLRSWPLIPAHLLAERRDRAKLLRQADLYDLQGHPESEELRELEAYMSRFTIPLEVMVEPGIYPAVWDALLQEYILEHPTHDLLFQPADDLGLGFTWEVVEK